MRTPIFWRVTLAYSLFTFCTTSMVIFRFPYFVGEGMDASIMSVAAGTAQVLTLVGAVTMGRQVAVVGLERLLALNMLVMTTCFILTLNVQNAFMMFAALYVWAWAINSLGALQGIVYAAYFGRRHAGAVRSVALLATMLFAAAAGPRHRLRRRHDGRLPGRLVALRRRPRVLRPAPRHRAAPRPPAPRRPPRHRPKRSNLLRRCDPRGRPPLPFVLRKIEAPP